MILKTFTDRDAAIAWAKDDLAAMDGVDETAVSRQVCTGCSIVRTSVVDANDPALDDTPCHFCGCAMAQIDGEA